MTQEGISFCLPTYKRVENGMLHSALESIEEVAPPPFEILVVMDEDDEESLLDPLSPHSRRIVVPSQSWPTRKWNVAARESAYDVIIGATDDLVWTKGNFPELSMIRRHGLLGLHDNLSRGCGSWTLWAGTRVGLQRVFGGVLFIPILRHVYADVAATLLAIKAGRNHVWAYEVGSHKHQLVRGKDVAIDESRRRAHAWRDSGMDTQTFFGWRDRGYPFEWDSLWRE